MRLVCPNCGAQYEVPDEVIPEAGRDVQCSNCGHTWFQANPDDDRGLAADLGQAERDEEWTPPAPPPPDPEPADPEPDDPEPEDETPQEDDTIDGPDAVGAPELGDTAPADDEGEEEPPIARRRRLDPEVASVLREEAEKEARARAADGPGLESQPDLGLQEPEELDEREKRAREARERMARMRGEADPDDAAAAAAANASRRNLLPDIDEINSTLRSTSERRTSAVEEAERDVEPDTRRSGGFRRGFLLAILVFALALVVYIYAPQIAERVPQLAGPLDTFVAWVDGLRTVLNGWLAAGLAWLDSMASTAGPGN